MGRRLKPLLVVPMAAAMIAGCGTTSNSHSSTLSTAGTTSTTTSRPATSSLTAKLPGRTAGAKPSLATLRRIPNAPRTRFRAHLTGLQGLTLTQKLQTLGSDVASLWVAEFSRTQTQLPPATLNIIDQPPATCNSTPIATGDPPEYCSGDGSVDLPLGFIQSNVAPIGDAALALVVSDLYGYHIENLVGALNPSSGLSGADLAKIDSCFSGIYFGHSDIQSHFQPGDEAAVNKLIAAKASASGSSVGAGAVTAADLTTAFNKGILGNGDFHGCLPPSAGGGGTTTGP